MNNQDLRVRRIGLLVRDLNRQLKMAADQKVAVNLSLEDISKPSDKVKRYAISIAGYTPGG